jgi:hypothetical protein
VKACFPCFPGAWRDLRVGVEELGSGDGCAGMRMVSQAGLEQFTNNRRQQSNKTRIEAGPEECRGCRGVVWGRMENGEWRMERMEMEIC